MISMAMALLPMTRCWRLSSPSTRWPIKWCNFRRMRIRLRRWAPWPQTARDDWHCPQRVDKIFQSMDRDKDAKLTFDEFVEGSKHDPTIVKVCILHWAHLDSLSPFSRLYLSTTALYNCFHTDRTLLESNGPIILQICIPNSFSDATYDCIFVMSAVNTVQVHQI